MSIEQAMIVGTNGETANVTPAGDALSGASVNVNAPLGIHRASLLGDAYAWPAVSADIDATDCMILVANTSSSRLLVISHCWARGDIAGNMNLKICSVAGLTLAGTAITGVNLNPSAGGIAPASAWGDETASPATSIIHVVYQGLGVNAQGTTSVPVLVDLKDSVILGENYAFGIDTILEPAAGYEATVFGYYIDA